MIAGGDLSDHTGPISFRKRRFDVAKGDFGRPVQPVWDRKRGCCCHVPDGRGASDAGTYPSLPGDVSLDTAWYPIAMVLKGRPTMLPFGWALTNIHAVAIVYRYGQRVAVR